MAQNRVDLVNIFSAVTQALAENQADLNQADEYNHDHGSNMVQTFQTITNSLQKKQGKSPSTALSYAANNLAKNTASGSGQLYAQALSQAASRFKGRQVDSKGALDLLQTLIGGGQTSPQSTGGDLLSTLLGQASTGAPSQSSGSSSDQNEDPLSTLLAQLTSGSQSQSTAAPASGADLLGTLLGQATGSDQPKPSPTSPTNGDMLTSLLGSLTGSQTTSTGASNGLDMGDIVNAGLSYMNAKQHGTSTAQALIQAFMSASGMGNRTERTQSTSLVVNSFLQALAGSGKAR